jgi:predicted ferric reductase
MVSVRREAPGVTSLYIAGRDLAALRPQAGQFFRWRFLTRDGWWQSHPFSLSTAPRAKIKRLRITVMALGDYTAVLQRTKPGTRVIAEGPYGAITWPTVTCSSAIPRASPRRPGELCTRQASLRAGSTSSDSSSETF